jgi:hypothetical protein
MQKRGSSAGAGVVGSVIIIVVGATMALTMDGADAAPIGWLLVVVGALALLANLVVGARTR